MKFGPVPVGDAAGAVLAHSMTLANWSARKGRRIDAHDVEILKQAGITEIIVAVLEAGDLLEDAAAERVAQALVAPGVEVRPGATGRVNLHAGAAGVFVADKALVNAVNAVDPAITLATLARYARVEKGQMVATVKIIPFAVPGAVVDRVVELGGNGEAFAVRPFRPRQIGLVQTRLPGTRENMLDKTVRVTTARLARSHSRLGGERRTGHDENEVAAAITALLQDCDMVVVFGASAMCDPDDVIPAAIRLAGGKVERTGMPVDPGNLIVLGSVNGRIVLGAPGCARSPKENGFDWVLDRLMADIPVTGADIAQMGVGGLLMEIASRPQPREVAASALAAKVHAVILGAGRSSRMGGPNKLLATFDGKAMIRRTAERALASSVSATHVVTGHQQELLRAALDGLKLDIVFNPDYASGMASSLKAGIAALPDDASGALILLGDMPDVDIADIDRLVAAFQAGGGAAVVRAAYAGRRGNPVVLPRALFASVATLQGDVGARHLIESGGFTVIDVDIGDRALTDVDTPDTLRRAGGVLRGG